MNRFLFTFSSICALLTIAFFAGTSYAQEYIFWSDSGQRIIWRANLDGTAVQPIAGHGSETTPYSLAVDDVEEKVYWATSAPDQIQRSSFDGSNREVIIGSLINPFGLTLDPVHRKIYWIDLEGIHRANLDGTTIESVAPALLNDFWSGIHVDPISQILYASVSLSGEITAYPVATLPTAPSTVAFLNSPQVPAKDLDNNLLYVMYVGQSEMINVSLINLSNPAPMSILTVSPPSEPRDSALNYPATHLYWADTLRQAIMRTSISSPAEEIFLPSPSPYGIALSCGKFAADPDNDGAPTCRDGCPADQLKVAPGVCGCGVSDQDSDNDGTVDCLDSCPTDSAKIAAGSCGCGAPDIDSDGDGILDCNDACPGNGLSGATGTCGCGIQEVDSDGDGELDCSDQCPTDATKVSAGFCGCGLTEYIAKDNSTVCFALRTLTKGTQNLLAPEVHIFGRDILVILEKFSGADYKRKRRKRKKKSPSSRSTFAVSYEARQSDNNGSPYSVRYQVSLAPRTPSVTAAIKAAGKRNEYTFKNLKPGDYSVSYRAQVVRKKKVVARTKRSPRTNFTIK